MCSPALFIILLLAQVAVSNILAVGGGGRYRSVPYILCLTSMTIIKIVSCVELFRVHKCFSAFCFHLIDSYPLK